MRNTKIFWLIFPGAVLITLISLFFIGWYSSKMGRDFYMEQLQAGIESRAYLVQPVIKHLYREDRDELHSYIRKAGRQSATRITLIDPEGVVLSDSNEDYKAMENHAGRPEIAKAFKGEIGASLRYSTTLGQSMLYVAIPTESPELGQAVLRLSLPTTPYENMIGKANRKMVWVAVLIMALAAFLAYQLARMIARPIEEMKRSAEQLTKGRIDQLVKINSNYMSVELAGLAGALNQMVEEINRRVRVIIQQRNELEAVFSSMADAVVAIDKDKKILRMNKAASNMFALPSESVQGKVVQGIIRNQQLLGLLDRAMTENHLQKEQVSIYDKSTRLELQTHAVPLCAENETIGALLVMHDLTKLNRLENIRQDFVANVSHELKTPITAIKGYVETMLDDRLEDREQAMKFLEVVAKQSNKLDDIIDDLLVLSRVENPVNTESIALTPGSISDMLESVRQRCKEAALEKQVTVTIQDDPELKAPLNQPLLEQALINLLINAIRYSPEKTSVTLRSFSSETMEGKKFANISVVDEGPGIAREHLPRLFERFYRCDKGRGRDQGGTGLGLAIVKHIANAHKGHVDVKSTVGKGSTFTLSIPIDETVVP